MTEEVEIQEGESLEDIKAKLKPKKAILTNLSPVLDYDYLRKILPKKIAPAFDRMTINCIKLS